MLEQYGLSKVGTWRLSQDYRSVKHLTYLPAISFELNDGSRWKRHVVYVFAFNGTPRYIGETSAGLGLRLEGYRYGNPLESDTDNRVKIALTEHLQKGGEVSIWCIQPETDLALGEKQLRIPVSKPVEEYLIRELKPDLNVKILKYES
jgi:hypothetical protein